MSDSPTPTTSGDSASSVAGGDSATIAVRLCSVTDVNSGEAKRFDVGELRIAVVRIDDAWYAIGDECSHADYSLSEGEVDAEECAIECWKHGSLFSLETGEPLTLPATKAVPVYALAVGESEVSVMLAPATVPAAARTLPSGSDCAAAGAAEETDESK